MSDVKCRVCREPWESYGNFSDMKRWEAALFKSGVGCPCCEGVAPRGVDTEEASLDAARSVVFGGTDDPDAHAWIYDIGANRPAWVPPERKAPQVHWTCHGCAGRSMSYFDEDGETDGPEWVASPRFYGHAHRDATEPALTVDGETWCDACTDRCEDCGETVATNDHRGDMYAPHAGHPHPLDQYHASICTGCLEELRSCSHCGEYLGESEDTDSDGKCESCGSCGSCGTVGPEDVDCDTSRVDTSRVDTFGQ